MSRRWSAPPPGEYWSSGQCGPTTGLRVGSASLSPPMWSSLRGWEHSRQRASWRRQSWSRMQKRSGRSVSEILSTDTSMTWCRSASTSCLRMSAGLLPLDATKTPTDTERSSSLLRARGEGQQYSTRTQACSWAHSMFPLMYATHWSSVWNHSLTETNQIN